MKLNIELKFDDQLVPAAATDDSSYKIENVEELLLQLQSLREEANLSIKGFRESIFYKDRNALDIIIKALNKSILKEKK